MLDRPEVIAIAQRHAASEDSNVLSRVTFVPGDMFDDVPAGDLYVLKTVIHDWDDVLEKCRDRLPEGGRVVCADKVLPPMGDTSCSGTKLLDMLMMVSLLGKERTEVEWRSLYERADLAVTSIVTVNPRSGESIIEGARR